jgi:UDP-2,3-diacylglucosamine hydrolase
MAIYFISDLHLDMTTPDMVAGFVRFTENLKDAESLYILGDFFEAWIGDDVETPVSQAVAAALGQLAQRGCRIHIMHGNRDFLIGNAFCQQCNAHLIPEGSVITLGSQTALLLHGDSLCTDDVAYQQVRTMLRNPAWQQDILSKSVEERIAFAKQARMESQSSNAMKSDDIMGVNQAAVEQALQEANVDLMIHGHTHRPFDHRWESGDTPYRRIVLGDWSSQHGWMIRFNPDEADCPDQGLMLEQFPLF